MHVLFSDLKEHHNYIGTTANIIHIINNNKMTAKFLVGS